MKLICWKRGEIMWKEKEKKNEKKILFFFQNVYRVTNSSIGQITNWTWPGRTYSLRFTSLLKLKWYDKVITMLHVQEEEKDVTAGVPPHCVPSIAKLAWQVPLPSHVSRPLHYKSKWNCVFVQMSVRTALLVDEPHESPADFGTALQRLLASHSPKFSQHYQQICQ